MSNSNLHSSLKLESDIQRAIILLDRLRATSDIPQGKLIELQRILQSDFLHSVREVYERVYDTVTVTGSPEMCANATAKATVNERVDVARREDSTLVLGCRIRSQ
jgi:protein lin-7